MAVAKVLSIPLLWIIPISILWYYEFISLWMTLILVFMLNLAYFFIQAVRYQLIFSDIPVKEVVVPKITYYCLHYQCKSWTARDTFLSLLNEKTKKILTRQGILLVLYFDNPMNVSDHSKERMTVGYAFKDEERDSEAEEILLSLGCEKYTFEECKAICASVRIVDNLTFFVTAIKAMGPLWDSVYDKYPDLILECNKGLPMFEWITKEKAKYAAPVGATRAQYKITRYSEPPWHQKAIKKFKEMEDSAKKME